MIKVTTNPDTTLVNEIRKKIRENNGHCACAIICNADNKCMCKEFREQIEKGISGECHCGLYIATIEK